MPNGLEVESILAMEKRRREKTGEFARANLPDWLSFLSNILNPFEGVRKFWETLPHKPIDPTTALVSLLALMGITLPAGLFGAGSAMASAMGIALGNSLLPIIESTLGAPIREFLQARFRYREMEAYRASYLRAWSLIDDDALAYNLIDLGYADRYIMQYILYGRGYGIERYEPQLISLLNQLDRLAFDPYLDELKEIRKEAERIVRELDRFIDKYEDKKLDREIDIRQDRLKEINKRLKEIEKELGRS